MVFLQTGYRPNTYSLKCSEALTVAKASSDECVFYRRGWARHSLWSKPPLILWTACTLCLFWRISQKLRTTNTNRINYNWLRWEKKPLPNWIKDWIVSFRSTQNLHVVFTLSGDMLVLIRRMMCRFLFYYWKHLIYDHCRDLFNSPLCYIRLPHCLNHRCTDYERFHFISGNNHAFILVLVLLLSLSLLKIIVTKHKCPNRSHINVN